MANGDVKILPSGGRDVLVLALPAMFERVAVAVSSYRIDPRPARQIETAPCRVAVGTDLHCVMGVTASTVTGASPFDEATCRRSTSQRCHPNLQLR